MPNGDVAIVCGGHAKTKYCACGREATILCDWKIHLEANKWGTCDKPICAAHAKQVAPGKHLCPEHQLRYDEWKRNHPPAQGALFEGAT
jgi:hypothetical protein